MIYFQPVLNNPNPIVRYQVSRVVWN